MKNILQVWPHFTYKQTPKNRKTFFEKYFTSKQMECKSLIIILLKKLINNNERWGKKVGAKNISNNIK